MRRYRISFDTLSLYFILHKSRNSVAVQWQSQINKLLVPNQSRSRDEIKATSIYRHNKSVFRIESFHSSSPTRNTRLAFRVTPSSTRRVFKTLSGFVIGVREFQLRIIVRNQRARRPKLLARCLSRRGASITVRVRSLRFLYKSAGYQRAEEKQRDRGILWEGRVDYPALSRYLARLTNGRDAVFQRSTVTVGFSYHQYFFPSTPVFSAIESFLFFLFSSFSPATIRVSSRPYRASFLPVIIEKLYSCWWLAGDYTAVDRARVCGSPIRQLIESGRESARTDNPAASWS